MFAYEGCKFGNERYKRNCARLAFFRDFKIAESYTLELSCFGHWVKETGHIKQFTVKDLLGFGEILLKTICRFFNVVPNPKWEKTGPEVPTEYGLDVD
jgi:hypothetical protein